MKRGQRISSGRLIEKGWELLKEKVFTFDVYIKDKKCLLYNPQEGKIYQVSN
jgi:hypothetical protein